MAPASSSLRERPVLTSSSGVITTIVHLAPVRMNSSCDCFPVGLMDGSCRWTGEGGRPRSPTRPTPSSDTAGASSLHPSTCAVTEPIAQPCDPGSENLSEASRGPTIGPLDMATRSRSAGASVRRWTRRRVRRCASRPRATSRGGLFVACASFAPPLAGGLGGERPDYRRRRRASTSAARAAARPGTPWAAPPGKVAALPRKRPRTGVRYGVRLGSGRKIAWSSA
jgi:hypothetical protein